MNGVYIILLIIAVLLLLINCFARTPEIHAPNAVTDLKAIEIGEMDQWIMIRGEDRSNPILLWLRGAKRGSG